MAVVLVSFSCCNVTIIFSVVNNFKFICYSTYERYDCVVTSCFVSANVPGISVDITSKTLRCSVQALGVTESRNRNARFPPV